MKLLLLILFCIALACIIFFYPKYIKTNSKLFILNSFNKDSLPLRFRKTPFFTSGSGQFSEKGLAAVRKEIPAKYSLFVVDLRQEAHGFLNGMGVSWFGQHNWYHVGLKREEIIEIEKKWLENLSKKDWVFLYHQRQYPIPHRIDSVKEEQEIAKKMGIGYFRLPVTDHRKPEDREVDTFVELVKTLSIQENPIWMHFHCCAGRGRTMTFLALHDIMLHAKKDSLKKILLRQSKGGQSKNDRPHLFDLKEEQEWKRHFIEERTEFIKKFYDYSRDVTDFSIPWSEWVKKVNSP